MADGKVALVTGGSRGIGASIVRSLAKDGYQVVFSYHERRDEADVLCAQLRGEGREGLALPCDVAQAEQIERLVAETAAAMGRIDVLVNNAGVHVPNVFFADLTDSDWMHVLDVNLTAPYRLARAVVPIMRSQGGGHIVNLSSNVTQRMPAGYGVYAVSKAGLEAFTRILAKEEGRHGIRVNGVGPGPIRTDMLQQSLDALGPEKAKGFLQSITMGRMGEPEEIAAVVSFLLSDAASYMTGQIVYVNGGGVM